MPSSALTGQNGYLNPQMFVYSDYLGTDAQYALVYNWNICVLARWADPGYAIMMSKEF